VGGETPGDPWGEGGGGAWGGGGKSFLGAAIRHGGPKEMNEEGGEVPGNTEKGKWEGVPSWGRVARWGRVEEAH